MRIVSAFTVAREILADNPSLDSDEVIRRARAKGARHPEPELRLNINKARSFLKNKTKNKPTAIPAAARHTSPKSAPKPEQSPVAVVTVDRAGVFANISQVNAVVGACGSVEAAREVAEAVQACGGVDAFLQHLELVAGIRAADKVD